MQAARQGGRPAAKVDEQGAEPERAEEAAVTITKAPAKRVSRHDQEAVSGYIFSIVVDVSQDSLAIVR